MKHTIAHFLSAQLTFIVGFAVSAVVAFLLVSHFQHTILQAWIGVGGVSSSQVDQTELVDTAYASIPDASQDLGCGCALCCSVPGL